MALVTTKEMFRRAYEGHYSIGAFNVDNLETLQATLEAAHECKSPVIIAITENVIKYFGITNLRALIDAAVKDYGVEVALHLDHGKSIEICKYCCDHGFTSVMIDASAFLIAAYNGSPGGTRSTLLYAMRQGLQIIELPVEE